MKNKKVKWGLGRIGFVKRFLIDADAPYVSRDREELTDDQFGIVPVDPCKSPRTTGVMPCERALNTGSPGLL